jgi:HD-GYP domain-containing protein (c-di-GMP phosphodiesterase class II)
MEKMKSSTAAGTQKTAEERLKISEEMYRLLADRYERLRKSFGVTINILVAAIEMRDPYTAGHQQRSANVACAIAQEMGLPEDIIEGINIASTIHDIGNLSIPVEILTKPSKLTGKEYSLVKEHARVGFEMFKDVELPWPLAEIIYQHHERMDGSGYPRKLKGDKILMEARVLAVADVVDAMSTQRPYRASLGLDAALEEIEKNKGILYDDAVSDACLRLFRGKGYRLT